MVNFIWLQVSSCRLQVLRYLGMNLKLAACNLKPPSPLALSFPIYYIYRMEQVQSEHRGYRYSSDKSLLQIPVIHRYLAEDAYWSEQIPLATVQTAIENSFCIGIYQGEIQVGFARIVTDYATFGYLADVFVLPEHRGIGLSKFLMECITALDWVNGLRRFSLATLDAQGLYSQFGFRSPEHPDRLLEITRPGMYKKLPGT